MKIKGFDMDYQMYDIGLDFGKKFIVYDLYYDIIIDAKTFCICISDNDNELNSIYNSLDVVKNLKDGDTPTITKEQAIDLINTSNSKHKDKMLGIVRELASIVDKRRNKFAIEKHNYKIAYDELSKKLNQDKRMYNVMNVISNEFYNAWRHSQI